MKNSRFIFLDNQSLDLFHSDHTAIFYEERAVLFAKCGDVVITRLPIDSEYIKDISILSNDYRGIRLISIGNRGNDLVGSISEKDLDSIRNVVHEGFSIRSFIPDEEIVNLSKMLGIPLIGNSFWVQNHRKSDLMRIGSSIGLPIIDGFLVTDPSKQKDNVLDFFKRHQTVVVKPDNSIGGIGLHIFSSAEQLLTYMQNITQDFILQQYIKPSNEGSVQFLKLDSNYCDCILICETYQKNTHYYGFTYKHNLSKEFSTVTAYAEKLLAYVENNYGCDIDWFGIDFIVNNNGIYFHDLNPRRTGTSYVLSFIAHIYPDFYLDKLFAVKSMLLTINCQMEYKNLVTIIKSNNLYYDTITKEGIAILNPALFNIHTIHLISCSRSGKEIEYLENISKYIRNSTK